MVSLFSDQRNAGGFWGVQKVLLLVVAMLVAPAVLAEEEPTAPQPPSAATADTVLTPQAGLTIKGLAVLSDPSQLRPAGWPLADVGAAGYDLSRIPAPVAENDGSRQIFQRLLGQPIVPATLQYVISQVQQAFVQAGRPFVVVTVPPQDMTSGVMQIVAVESRLGQVTVTGQHHFSQQSYADAIRAKPGEPIDAGQLNEDLNWLAENPYRSATVKVQPGAQPGQTDLMVQAADRRPWRVFAGIDNTGSRVTQLNRYQVGVNYGNLFGRGHQIGLQRIASPDNESSVSHSLSYIAPLPWHDTLTVSGNYGTIHSKLPAPFDQTGRSGLLALRYKKALPGFSAIRHSISAGFDYKMADNNLLFSSIPVIDNPTRIYQLALSWNGQRPDKRGGTALGGSLFYSPGNMGTYNDDVAFSGSRFGAEASYSYFNMNVQRTTTLPLNLVLDNNLVFQWTQANLLGSEQLAATGTNAVRGFDENLVNGDRGFILRNELQYTLPGGASRWLAFIPPDNLQCLVFVDAAQVGASHLMPGETPHIFLASAGVGLRWQMGKQLSLRADIGRPLHLTASPLPGVHAHAGLNLSF